MKKTAFSLIVILFATMAFSLPNDWMYLVTKDQFGSITRTTTYEDLTNLFGKEELTDERQSGPEGEGEFKCTIVYKGTDQELTVYWDAKGWHKKITSVACTHSNSPYHTESGIKIGTNLNQLIKLNKAAISFYGFEWDYGGTISNYHKGALEKAKVFFTLGWKAKNDTALLGDGELTSKMPKVIKRAKDIYVAKMVVNFSD